LVRNYDAIVVGGGAAGLLCAAVAGKRGRRVAVLERSGEIGKKILISGGGRCNFTNIYAGPENFLSANPHFARSALARYTPRDFLCLVEKHRIPWHEKKLGQLFCDRSARDVVGMLATECRAGGVDIVVSCRISSIRRATEFVAESDRGEFRAPALIVSAGGLSIPKIGATPFGYEVAKQFGHKVVPTRPALVPLVFSEADRKTWCDLAGVALDVEACVDSRSFRERMLITHRGLSGPAILQISSYWSHNQPVRIDLLPGAEPEPKGNRKWGNVLALAMPRRFAERYIDIFHSPERIHQWEIMPAGTEGYAKAEVTAGGVDTAGLSSKTMESRIQPGLFFIGEVVDVTGWLGGYNFQWAWASAAAAGQAV
jgi:predicted Rossmann fold flavoprotein